jgi:hypothetical protein
MLLNARLFVEKFYSLILRRVVRNILLYYEGFKTCHAASS